MRSAVCQCFRCCTRAPASVRQREQMLAPPVADYPVRDFGILRDRLTVRVRSSDLAARGHGRFPSPGSGRTRPRHQLALADGPSQHRHGARRPGVPVAWRSMRPSWLATHQAHLVSTLWQGTEPPIPIPIPIPDLPGIGGSSPSPSPICQNRGYSWQSTIEYCKGVDCSGSPPMLNLNG